MSRDAERCAGSPGACLAPVVQSIISAVGIGIRDAVVGLQDDGTIVTWNRGAEEIFGYREDEILGTAVNRLFPAFAGREATVLPAGEFLPGRPARFRTKTGEEFEALLTVVTISPDGTGVIGSVAVVEPASPQASCLQKETLQQLEKNIEQLVTLNDRIRNPLQVIAALAEFVDDDTRSRILLQVEAINEVVRQLDRGTLESTAVREYLRKHRWTTAP